VMQLTLVPGIPVEAAARFFGQQGMTASRVSEQTINGLPAVVGQFQADTQSNRIGGLAAFIRHQEQTFHLLAITPVERLAHHGPAFNAAINSFARLTDVAALARQPDRIAIVRTDQAMTLTTFNQHYPSVIDLNILAVINQLPGPDAAIPARSLVKRVQGDDRKP
jgi:predicted Zn-dependent protease